MQTLFKTWIAPVVLVAAISLLTTYLSGFNLSITVSIISLAYFDNLQYRQQNTSELENVYSLESATAIMALVVLSQSLSVLTGVAVSKDLGIHDFVEELPYEYMLMGSTFAISTAMIMLASLLATSTNTLNSCIRSTKLSLCLLHTLAISSLYFMQTSTSIPFLTLALTITATSSMVLQKHHANLASPALH